MDKDKDIDSLLKRIFYVVDHDDYLNEEEQAKLAEVFGNEPYKVTYQLIPKRVKEFNAMCELVKNITKGDNTTIECKLDDHSLSSGSARVAGKEIVFDDMELFSDLVKMSDGIDIIAKLDGTIELDFSMLNLAERIVNY